MDAVQRLSAQVVRLVLDGRNLPTALETVVPASQATPSTRATVQALGYGTLRQLGYLRFALASLAPKPPHHPLLAALLWVALYQLEYSETPAYAVVDGAVECAASIGGLSLKRFVNAVLRSYQRRRTQLRAAAAVNDEARFSYPRWWIDKLRRQFGDGADAVLEAGNGHPPMALRVNLRRTDVHAYVALLRGQSIGARAVGTSGVVLDAPLPVTALPGFSAGLVSVQDPGAQLAASLLDVHDGQRILDACAAPGGKTAHLLEIADAEVIAIDSDSQRLSRVEQNLRRLGLEARLLCADAGDADAWWDGRTYDRVLLDAPCSASGVVRRHPDSKWLRRPGDIERFAAQQSRLLDALWKVLARGGKLLYVTCSIFSEENQDQVGAFVSHHADARHVAQPGAGLMLPNHEHDGFFYALVEKT